MDDFFADPVKAGGLVGGVVGGIAGGVFAMWLGMKKLRSIAPDGNCPQCGAKLPLLRMPRSLKEAMWVGNAFCPKCGFEAAKK